MDDSGYKWFVSAGIVAFLFIASSCVIGFADTLFRISLLIPVLAVASVCSEKGAPAAGGFLTTAAFLVDGLIGGLLAGLISGLLYASITLLAILIAGDEDSDVPTHTTHNNSPKVLRVELVDKRYRRRRRKHQER